MSSLAFLVTELQSLASETRRKHPDVREAADKSLAILRASPEQAISTLSQDGPQSSDLLRPVFMGCATRNAKVVAISLGSLQRLIMLKAVPRSAVPVIVATMEECLNQGVDIQLRILQVLSSLLTNFKEIKGDLLSDVLLLCFKLQESRIAVVSSTAAATLRQLVMFIFEKVVEENKTSVPDAPRQEISLPNSTHAFLLPFALDAFMVFQDLCLLANSERPRFLRLESLQRTFALELIESVLTNYWALFRASPPAGNTPLTGEGAEQELSPLLLTTQHYLSPLLLKSLSDPKPSFPLTLRSTRVVFLLLKQFNVELPTEAEVFLMLLVRIIDGNGMGEAPWMRVLAMEVVRGLCADPPLLRSFYRTYDSPVSSSDLSAPSHSQVFTALISSLKRLATEKPVLLGVGVQLFGLGVDPGTTAAFGTQDLNPSGSSNAGGGGHKEGGGYLPDVAGMMASAARGTANAAAQTVNVAAQTMVGVVGMMSTSGSGLSIETAGMKVQCIDQLDKADAPSIPDTYVYLLALQSLVAISDGFASVVLPSYNAIMLSRRRPGEEDSSLSKRAPPALDFTAYEPESQTLILRDSSTVSEPKLLSSLRDLKTVHDMLTTAWPALLSSLSFLLSTNLSPALFASVLSALSSLTSTAGVLGLSTPRDAFLSSLAKVAVPGRVVTRLEAYVDPPPTPRSAGVLTDVVVGLAGVAGVTGAGGAASGPLGPPGLSEKNLACLKSLVGCALYLAGSLGAAWYPVLEALQNAEYVLTSKGSGLALRNAQIQRSVSLQSQRSVSSASLGTGGGGMGSATLTPSSSAGGGGGDDIDAESMLAAIGRLFDASKNLEDEAFREFVGALCRLSREMIGMQAAGTGSGVVLFDVDDTTGTANAQPAPTPTEQTHSNVHRRRVSGIHLTRTLRTGDFGIAKLGLISLPNIHRLIYRDPSVAWTAVTSHLLAVLRHPLAPPPIRIQAATVLDDILVVVPRNLGSVGNKVQGEVQRRLLDVLAAQVTSDMGSIVGGPGIAGTASTVVDIRKMGLETLQKILQSSAHTFVLGWETIFEMLGSVCKPPPSGSPLSAGGYSTGGSSAADTDSTVSSPATPRQHLRPPPLTSLTDKVNLALIRIAFQSLTLVCDTLSSLSPEHLRLCISTLGLFGRQADTNIALTAAESLLWGVSDSIQGKRKDADTEPEYSALWMFLLLELLGLCSDSRPEVRGGAIQTLFRTLQLYGSTLSLETWDECLWSVVFPLLDNITASIRHAAALASPDAPSTSPHSVVTKAWDDSKTLAMHSVGGILNDYLGTKIMRLPSFEKAWNVFVEQIQDAFLFDQRTISTAALRCLEKAVKACLKVATQNKESQEPGAEELNAVIIMAVERVWVACDEMGASVTRWSALQSKVEAQAPSLPLTQEALLALVDLLKTTRELNRALTGQEWELERLKRLLAILKGVLTYPNSPDYRPDIDQLTPVQADVLEAIAGVDLTVQGAPSIVLCDLSEYSTLAFVAAFDVQTSGAATTDPNKPPKRITYIALCKKTMPLIVRMYLDFKDQPLLYQDGTLEAMLSAYSIPIKLKYECPSPSKFGSDSPLWKTATISFLGITKECAPRIKLQEISDDRVEGIWRQIVDVFRGGLLADCSAADNFSLEVQETEENFDLSLIATLEVDVIPYIGDSGVPDYLISQLAGVLHNASRLLEFDEDGPPNRKRPSEFVPGLGIDVVGSTTTGMVFPRERFAYWCLDLLFGICANRDDEHTDARKRVAALSLPSLLSRCQLVLTRYVADDSLRGNAPFPRVREEELTYTLRKLLELDLWPGSLWAAFSDSPTEHAHAQPDVDTSLPLSAMMRDLTRRSPKAHLFHFFPVLCDIASIPRHSPSAFALGGPPTPPDSQSGSPLPVEVDARSLARSCLKKIGREMGVAP